MGFSDPQAASQPRGIMMLRPEVRGKYDFFRISQTGCHVRFYPELDAKGNPMPIRSGRTIADVGNWVNASHYGISYLGGNDPAKEKVTMLLSIRGDNKIQDPNQRRGLRVWEQLRNTLYYRLAQGTAPPHWSRWAANQQNSTFGTQQKSKAKPFCFARGLITHYMTSNGPLRNVTPQTPKTRCIFLLPPAAQTGLIEVVMEENEDARNYQGGDDWDKVFKYNSKIVDPNTGCMISFGRPGQANPAAFSSGMASPQPVQFGHSASATPQFDSSQFRVEAKVMENNSFSIPLNIIADCMSDSWDDILQVYDDERALILALETGFPDELIIAAFGDQPELLSERLRNKMQQKTTSAAAGNFNQPVNTFTNGAGNHSGFGIPAASSGPAPWEQKAVATQNQAAFPSGNTNPVVSPDIPFTPDADVSPPTQPKTVEQANPTGNSDEQVAKSPDGMDSMLKALEAASGK